MDDNYESLAAAIGQASFLHDFYQALVNEGFDDEQATVITIAYMQAMFEATRPRWWQFWRMS